MSKIPLVAAFLALSQASTSPSCQTSMGFCCNGNIFLNSGDMRPTQNPGDWTCCDGSSQMGISTGPTTKCSSGNPIPLNSATPLSSSSTSTSTASPSLESATSVSLSAASGSSSVNIAISSNSATSGPKGLNQAIGASILLSGIFLGFWDASIAYGSWKFAFTDMRTPWVKYHATAMFQFPGSDRGVVDERRSEASITWI